MVPVFHQSCNEVVGKWDKMVSDKGSSCEVDVWPGFMSITEDVISRTAFGSSYKEGQRIFELQTELAQLIIQAFRKSYIPGYRYLPTKDNRRIKAAAKEAHDILRGLVNKRLRAREAGEAPNEDLLGILLESNLGQAKGNGMSIEDVIEECKLFYFAGQETTSVLLVWTMILLSQHQDWQARAREEVEQVFGDKEPNTEGLNHLKMMTMIINEVIRLYPPVTQLSRTIHKEMKLGDLTLPGGVQINLPIMLVQRETQLWGNDAAEFKPERFEDGRTFFSWRGTIPSITITDPEQIKEVFNKVYDFPKPHTFPLTNLIISGLFSYDGDKWAKHRRIINPAFHLEKIKNMVPVFHQSCNEVVDKWDKMVSDKGSSCEVDVWPGLMSITEDVISRTAFGSSYKEGQRIFELQTELAQLIIQAFRKSYIPGYRYLPTKDNRRIKAAAKETHDILRGLVNKRLRAREAGEAPNEDLLGILLESNLGQAKGNGMSIDDVIEECKLFYFAGQETTSVLLVWTMILLSQHQDWQARAREEVKQVFGDKEPNTEGLNHLKIMTMIINEVIRLYPPVTQLSRTIHKEMKLGDLTLPGGVQINLPIMLVQRETQLWGNDAAEFKPERFEDGVSKATKSQVSFFPFAWGPRICIGQNFALLEAKMAMALILQRFSFELSPTYTLDIYDGTGDFLRGLDVDEDTLTKAVIGTIGDVDSYQLPDAKGYSSLLRHLLNVTDEERQIRREEILSTSLKDFKEFAEAVDSVRDKGVAVAVASQEDIDAANKERSDFFEVKKAL
ncbi:hypothetical protein F2Q70_00042625 [Brassica cretica]|uniref:Uncharacterized protein n=1 Tax=Brassica cretica TaxID=69181 RepID=A0A8S9KEE5_BRACR|nr:hypothetical protein F2Q70_00042625 [Brassica cretica]